MATDYILSAAGTTNPVLEITPDGGTLFEVPTLQDVTINNSNDTFTWSQLNESAKLQVVTTATNSITANIVVEEATFFGTGKLLDCSTKKTEVAFSINLGTKTISGIGYISGLAPAVSADSPVWVTPITIAVSGEYTVA